MRLRAHTGPTCPRVVFEPFEYRTSDDSLAYEFTLYEQGNESGYILVAGSRALPPILEYCASGSRLSNLVRRNADELFLRIRALRAVSTTWRYFGPLDIAAEFELSNGHYCYARFPNLHVTQRPARILFSKQDTKYAARMDPRSLALL